MNWNYGSEIRPLPYVQTTSDTVFTVFSFDEFKLLPKVLVTVKPYG